MSFFTNLQLALSALTKPQQKIALQELPPGRIIDIGGGGEGVIARAGGARVVAVDQYLSEIHEARGKAREAGWLAADATHLPCQNQSFEHATAFFSGMYMSDEIKNKVFRETHRVLKPGGEFWIWDACMTSKNKVFALRLQVELPGAQQVKTAYGVKAKDQSAEKLGQMLRETGFEVTVIAEHKHWFWIKAKKD